MDESINNEPLKINGCFADMYSPTFEILTTKTVMPGENALLCDINKISNSTAIIGTSVRINSLNENEEKITLDVSGAGKFTANIRLKSNDITCATIDEKPCEFSYDNLSGTVLLNFESKTGNRKIDLIKK